MKKVFLGGTCNGSTWRNELIPKLTIDYFNPVVDNWKEENYKQELIERINCDFCLYTFTKEMLGVYSVAEVVDDSNKKPESTICCLLEDGFSKNQLKSLDKVGILVENNGGAYFKDLDSVAKYLNEK